MKSIVTIFFFLFIGMFAQAKSTSPEVAIKPMTEGIILAETLEADTVLETTLEVARLYRRANARVTKALSFTTKRDRSKMA